MTRIDIPHKHPGANGAEAEPPGRIRSTETVLSQTDPLGLRPLRAGLRNKLDRAANAQLFKARVGQVVATEVILVTVGCADKAKAPFTVQAHHLAVQGMRVLFFHAALAPGQVFNLTRHVINGVAQRDVNIFMFNAICDEFMARQETMPS